MINYTVMIIIKPKF